MSTPKTIVSYLTVAGESLRVKTDSNGRPLRDARTSAVDGRG